MGFSAYEKYRSERFWHADWTPRTRRPTRDVCKPDGPDRPRMRRGEHSRVSRAEPRPSRPGLASRRAQSGDAVLGQQRSAKLARSTSERRRCLTRHGPSQIAASSNGRLRGLNSSRGRHIYHSRRRRQAKIRSVARIFRTPGAIAQLGERLLCKRRGEPAVGPDSSVFIRIQGFGPEHGYRGIGGDSAGFGQRMGLLPKRSGQPGPAITSGASLGRRDPAEGIRRRRSDAHRHHTGPSRRPRRCVGCRREHGG